VFLFKTKSNIDIPCIDQGSKWSTLIIVGGAVVIIMLVVLGFVMTKKREPQPQLVIDSIQVISDDGLHLIATVSFSNGRLEYVCEQESLCIPLKEYFATTLPDMMTNGAELSIGGCDKHGCWDGVKTVSVQDEDFLEGVYATLYDDLNRDYQVQAIERTAN